MSGSARAAFWRCAGALAAAAVVAAAAGPAPAAAQVRIAKMKPAGAAPTAAPTPAAVTGSLTYYGGRVVSGMNVVQVLWGSPAFWGAGSYDPSISSTASPSVATFYQGVLNSAYVDWLRQYNTNIPASGGGAGTYQDLVRGSFVGQYVIAPSTGNATSLTDAQVQSELVAQINAGNLPLPTKDAGGNTQTLYSVFFPHGVSITMGGATSCVQFCAYHGTIANATLNSVPGQEFYYAVQPDFQSNGCTTGCGPGTAFQNICSTASHEMIETMTDAEVGIATVNNAAPLAWYDTTDNGEISDLCNQDQRTVVGSDNVTYTVQANWSNLDHACIATRTYNDFTLGVSPGSNNLAPGGTVQYTVSTAVAAGSAESIALAVTGLPSGVTGAFNPTSVTAGASSTLTLSATAGATLGSATFRVAGVATSTNHSQTATVNVQNVANDYSMNVTPSSQTVQAGQSTQYTVSTAVTSGTAQTVSLGITGLPSGVTPTFNPTSVTAGSSSTLTLATTTSVPAQTYGFTVTGTGTSANHTALGSLTVTAAPPPPANAIVNGGFETCDFTGWSRTGATSIVTSGAHSGSCAAMVGSAAPSGNSGLTQSFKVPSPGPSGHVVLTLWYNMTCNSTGFFRDFATVFLNDATHRGLPILFPTCTKGRGWQKVTYDLTADVGQTVQLTLSNHDDGVAGTGSFTLYDDVSVQ